MTDRELLYIKIIAEERNISAAAKKLFMTQPALSHCLGSLEQETGTPLFVRTPKGLDMTFAGECYYNMAVEILDIYNDYQQKLVDISQMRRGRVRIGITRHLGAIILPKTLPEFSQSYPNVEVQVREANSVDLEREIIARRLDFALIHGFAILDRQPSDNIEYQILSRDDFCIITKRGAPIGGKAVRMTGYPYPVLDPKYLENEPFILETPSHRMRVVTDEIFKRVNIAPRIVMETELFETTQRLAEAGYGVTVINERYIKEFIDVTNCDIYSIPKKYKPYWLICMIRHAKGYMPVASRELLKIIERVEAKKI